MSDMLELRTVVFVRAVRIPGYAAHSTVSHENMAQADWKIALDPACGCVRIRPPARDGVAVEVLVPVSSVQDMIRHLPIPVSVSAPPKPAAPAPSAPPRTAPLRKTVVGPGA
jgi:hypothetical protein